MNGSDLSRQLLGRELVPSDYYFVQGRVRAMLQKFNCPRENDGYRPHYSVSEKMADRVAAALKMSRNG